MLALFYKGSPPLIKKREIQLKVKILLLADHRDTYIGINVRRRKGTKNFLLEEALS
jgi:hypothetical protein